MHSSVKISARAKVNLWLEVFNRRPDGFHEIESLVSPIALCDELEIETSKKSGVELELSFSEELAAHLSHESGAAERLRGVLLGSDNLAFRAASEFFKCVGPRYQTGIRIKLLKQTPAGAGLGGGSSDAAAVLRGLNQLLGGPLTYAELESLGARLGSDVPAILFGQPVVVTGRGEEVYSDSLLANILENLNILLVKPCFHVSTHDAYQLLNRPCAQTLEKVSKLREMLTILPRAATSLEPRGPEFFEKLPGLLRNDFQQPLVRHFPELEEVQSKLYDLVGDSRVLMSGSGSAFFAICRSAQEAAQLALEVKRERDEKGWFIIPTVLNPTPN